MSDTWNQEDWDEWTAEMEEHYTDERIRRLTHADAVWHGAKPGGWDERTFNAILRIGRRVRRWLRLS